MDAKVRLLDSIDLRTTFIASIFLYRRVQGVISPQAHSASHPKQRLEASQLSRTLLIILLRY